VINYEIGVVNHSTVAEMMATNARLNVICHSGKYIVYPYVSATPYSPFRVKEMESQNFYYDLKMFYWFLARILCRTEQKTERFSIIENLMMRLSSF